MAWSLIQLASSRFYAERSKYFEAELNGDRPDDDDNDNDNRQYLSELRELNFPGMPSLLRSLKMAIDDDYYHSSGGAYVDNCNWINHRVYLLLSEIYIGGRSEGGGSISDPTHLGALVYKKLVSSDMVCTVTTADRLHRFSLLIFN